MKRIAVLTVTIIILMATLTSCIIIPRHHKYEIDATTVSSIEIYDLCESESTYRDFVEVTESVCEIPADKIPAFIEDLCNLQFKDYIIIVLAAIDPSFHYGIWTVRVNYTDGSYALISCAGYGQTFDKNGECIKSNHWSCEEEDWAALIEKYIPGEIFNHH